MTIATAEGSWAVAVSFWPPRAPDFGHATKDMNGYTRWLEARLAGKWPAKDVGATNAHVREWWGTDQADDEPDLDDPQSQTNRASI